MDVLRNNEEKVMCPYNPSHYIRKFRMEVHLHKCRKSYRESVNLIECDFNACHRIPEPELQYHHETCPDRKGVELQIYSEEEPVCAPILTRPPMPVPVDESWDDVDVPSYNPQKYCEENDILRYIDTESAATRREFRISERRRLNNLGPSKTTTRGRREPNQDAFAGGNQQNLPPTPGFSTSSIEQTPDNVVSMMDRLSLIPKRAVIPKPK